MNTYVASESIDGEIRFMCKAFKKAKAIRRYMKSLTIHTGAPAVNWKDNANCIYVVEDKRVTPRVKYIDIPVYFLQAQFENGIFYQI